MSAFLVMIDGTPLTQEARIMRLSVASLRQMVKGPLHVQQLRSYSGLEMLRCLGQLDLPQRLQAACAATGGDYGEDLLHALAFPLAHSVGTQRVARRAITRPVRGVLGHVWGHVDQPEGFDKGAS
jgi:hypothetical protein